MSFGMPHFSGYEVVCMDCGDRCPREGDREAWFRAHDSWRHGVAGRWRRRFGWRP